MSNSRGSMAETIMDPSRSQPMKKLNLFFFSMVLTINCVTHLGPE